jgi:CDP-glycerol glycerophosphotransferase
MATFTFSRGNTERLRRLPQYLLGMLVTFVVPRSDRIWVFGSGIGPGEGALPLYRLARERLGSARLVWLASTDHELAVARDLGLDAVGKFTVGGWWLTLRARVLVVTHGQGDVNRYAARGGFLVQLWHGIPLKRLHLDSPAALEATVLGSRTLGRLLVRGGLHVIGRQITLFPVSSQRIQRRIVSAFGVAADHVVATGDPRDDVLLRGTPDERRADARALLTDAVGPIGDATRVVLYAPTWREGDPDPAAPTPDTWADIADWLEKVDAVLVVRSHPLGAGDYAAGPERSDRVRLLDASAVADLTPVLPAVDHLVTDYSSVAYDFALTGGSTVYLAADVMTYVSTRGLYDPYSAFSGGRDVAGWTAALARLDALVAGEPAAVAAAAAHTERILDEHFDHLDGRATERVFAEIVHRTTGAAVPFVAARRRRPTVVAATLGPEQLRLTLDPAGVDVTEVRLDGHREHVVAALSQDGDRLVADLPVVGSRWGHEGLALPTGRYRLTVVGPIETQRVDVAVDPLPHRRTDRFAARLTAVSGGLSLLVDPPLADDEVGAANQQRLRVEHLRPVAQEEAVWFESFYGRAAADNPLALDRVIAETLPHVTRYWSVVDRSVPVPAGAVPVVEFSREWWRSRAAARVLVVNDWLRWAYRPRQGQHVLQTWHGTMLKRLALDRPGRTPREQFATVRQSRRWDALLAQNDYSVEHLRSAYGYRGPVWVDGYPRNDRLRDPERAARVRERLGVSGTARLVLYAPTWRDDSAELVDHLDLARFAHRLPAGVTLLVRGHSRTLTAGRDLHGERIVDATTYPDVADLMLVADVLVTDYSSVMFDFAVTGRPMVFHAPDVDHFEKLRGFYFDLTGTAPGPVTRTADQLLAALTEVLAGDAEDARSARYAAWRDRFCPGDDGHAAGRVLERMLAEGWLSR